MTSSANETSPCAGPRQWYRPPPRRTQREAVHGATDQRVLAVCTRSERALEAGAGARGADARDPRQGPVEGAVQNAEPLAGERVERQPVGQPGAIPTTPWTDGASATTLETAPPIEKPTSSVRPHGQLPQRHASVVDAQSRCSHDLMR